MFIKLERKLLALILMTLFLFHIPGSFVQAQTTNPNGHLHNVNDVEWNHNGTILASASRDSSIKFWSPSGEYLKLIQSPIFGHFDSILDIEWSADDEYLASSGTNESSYIWDVSDDELADPHAIFIDHIEFVKTIAWNPSPNNLGLIASADNNGEVMLWNATNPNYALDDDGNETVYIGSGTTLFKTSVHESLIYDMAWSTNGEILSSVSQDGKHFVYAYNSLNARFEALSNSGFGVSDPEPYIDLGTSIYSFAVDSSGEYFTYATNSSIVTYRGSGGISTDFFPYLPTPTEVSSLPIDCNTCLNMDVKLSPEEDKIAIAAESAVYVYGFDAGIETDNLLFTFDVVDAHAAESDYISQSTHVVSVSWHPDNTNLAFAAGPDVFVYNTNDGSRVFRIVGEVPNPPNVIIISFIVILVLIILWLIIRRQRRKSII